MIDSGMKNAEIAAQLNNSNTVSCHRQEIIGKLQVKNTLEVCLIAMSMGQFKIKTVISNYKFFSVTIPDLRVDGTSMRRWFSEPRKRRSVLRRDSM